MAPARRDDPTADPAFVASGARLRVLIPALLIVALLGALDHTVVATSLVAISGELGGVELMAWVIVGYSLATVVLLPVAGRLGDLLGPRVVFLTSLATFVAASFACGFAQDIGQLVAARVVQGAGAAGTQLMSQTILAYATSPRQRPRYMSIIGAAFPAAILVGPLLGGAVTDFWGWPWLFWINVPLGLAAFVAAWVAVPRGARERRGGFDLLGALAFTVAVVPLVLAVTWAPEPRMQPAATAMGALAAVGIAAFLVIEARVASPMMPLRLFRDRAIATNVGLAAVISIGFFGLTAYLPTFGQMAYGVSATVSGFLPLATVAGMLLSSLATGWLSSRTGRFKTFPIVGTSLGAAGMTVMWMLPAGGAFWLPMLVMAVVGIGVGSFMSLVVAVAQSAAPSGEVGAVTALATLVRQVGATVSTAIIGAVVGAVVVARLPAGVISHERTAEHLTTTMSTRSALVAEAYTGAFAPVFLALAGVFVIGVVTAIVAPGGRLHDDAAT